MKKKGAASAARLACALAGAIVIIAGCHKVTGGGWIAGVNGGKATFGFQGQCRSGTVEVDFGGGPMTLPEVTFYEGQFQYQDRSAGVRFHGKINPNNFVLGYPGSCDELVADIADFGLPTNEAEFTGECTSQPGGVTGTFKVTVVDGGKPGPDAADEVTVATPNFFLQPIFDADWNVIGEEVVPIGAPCTADGQPYSNSGLLGGGNIAMPGHKS